MTTGSPGPSPAVAAAPTASGNPPVAGGSSPSPFAGSFPGDGVTLVLRGPASGLAGEIVRSGRSYPAAATSDGPSLDGTFTVDGASFAFTAAMDGEAVALEGEGTRFRLEPVR